MTWQTADRYSLNDFTSITSFTVTASQYMAGLETLSMKGYINQSCRCCNDSAGKPVVSQEHHIPNS